MVAVVVIIGVGSGVASPGFWGLSDVVVSELLLQLAASSAKGINRLRTR